MLKSNHKLFDEALVLVVSNNDASRSQLNTHLVSAGLKPIFVSNGEKGLSVIRHARESNTALALVICDHTLSDMTGVEFVRTVRENSAIANTKIVLTTRDDSMGYLPVFQPMGISHIVQWPGRVADLTGAIAEYIPLRREIQTVNQGQTGAAATQAQPFRILAADDNAINLAVLKSFLSLAGYTPDTVENGEEAVKAFKNYHYDLILMDISMPIMDGVEATHQIREIENRIGKAPVPIVAVTAHYTSGQKHEYLSVGMNDVIAKPIHQNVIERCLNEWSSQNRSAETQKKIA